MSVEHSHVYKSMTLFLYCLVHLSSLTWLLSLLLGCFSTILSSITLVTRKDR